MSERHCPGCCGQYTGLVKVGRNAGDVQSQTCACPGIPPDPKLEMLRERLAIAMELLATDGLDEEWMKTREGVAWIEKLNALAALEGKA